MKKEQETRKSAKSRAIPFLKEQNSINLMKQSIEDINFKLKEKQTNVQNIVSKYFEFDINITTRQKLLNLKNQMINQEKLNVTIILLIDLVLKKQSQKQWKRDSFGKFISPKSASNSKDVQNEDQDEDEEKVKDNYSEEQSEDDSQSLSEEKDDNIPFKKSTNPTRINTQAKPKLFPPMNILKVFQSTNNQDIFQAANNTSNKIKGPVILPQSKDIKKQQTINTRIKNSTHQQKTNRITHGKQLNYKTAGEVNKKIEINYNQVFQNYLTKLKKVSINYSLDIPKYFLSQNSFIYRVHNKLFNIRPLFSKEEKLFVVRLVKSQMNNYSRVSEMLMLSKSIILRIVKESSKRRIIIRNNEDGLNQSKQEESSESQSSDEDSERESSDEESQSQCSYEDDESETDEESIDTDDKCGQKEKQGFICSSVELQMTELEIKKEEEEEQQFLREREWLRKEGLLLNYQDQCVREYPRSQFEQFYLQEDIKIEEELNQNIVQEPLQELTDRSQIKNKSDQQEQHQLFSPSLICKEKLY